MAKFELMLPGGVLTAKSIRELVAKIEAEANFWSTFQSADAHTVSSASYVNQWASQAVSYIQQIVIFWPNHIDTLKSLVNSETMDGFSDFKAHVESTTPVPPYSASRVATLAKRLFEKSKVQESIALLVGASGQSFAQLGVLHNQAIDQAAYVSFGRALATFVDLNLEAAGNIEAFTRSTNDAKVIESLSNDMGLLISDASSARDNFFEKSERTSKTFFGKLKRLRENEIKYFRDARRDERERTQRQNSEFNALMEAFNAHLRLKRPVDLWKERSQKHDGASNQAWGKFFWGAVLFAFSAAVVAFFLGGVIAESFIDPNCVIGSEPQCSRISARGPLNISLLLMISTTWLWYLRLQMRIFLSERHLTLDAQERMAFAETYLSLLKGAEVSRDHETVVLQSLMRPTQDGIIKDDSGPEFALSSLLAKALERK
jgi:Family of unknown function (DUF6161)